ncbi:hypothetical protein chiPu_0022685 [Chiloscyllium punctatum]|uniref:SH2 domain-containing protein n=1 Tax=Chiloscyllium punctatum TaxID=137246 RepID=A0A401T8D2_CHIPU|nr:hypothetical protein [Chiloscyllium punctatum]
MLLNTLNEFCFQIFSLYYFCLIFFRRFAGNLERGQADNLLKTHISGTYLIRERTAEAERFAISIRFNDEVKHIKVVEKDNWIHITEAKKFESLLVCFLFLDLFSRCPLCYLFSK